MDRVGLRQIGVFAALGAVIWFAVTLLLRFFVVQEITDGPWRLALYGLGVPSGALVMWVFHLAGARKGQMFTAIAIGTMVAVILDGLAIGWARGIYGSDPSRVTDAAGVILWGAGIGMLMALWLDLRKTRRPTLDARRLD